MGTDKAYMQIGFGVSLNINSKNKIIIMNSKGERTFLGKATKERCDQLIEKIRDLQDLIIE